MTRHADYLWPAGTTEPDGAQAAAAITPAPDTAAGHGVGSISASEHEPGLPCRSGSDEPPPPGSLLGSAEIADDMGGCHWAKWWLETEYLTEWLN